MESIFIFMNLLLLIIISYSIGSYINNTNKCNKYHYVPYREEILRDEDEGVRSIEINNHKLMNVSPNIVRYYHFADNISDISFF